MKHSKAFFFAEAIALLHFTPAAAETANLKYRGPVDLAPFECEAIGRLDYPEFREPMLARAGATLP